VITLRDRYRGCLLGGAVGDALGAGIEFLSLDDIRGRHGPSGVTGYVPAYGRAGTITDDTQMTLFTAEGLLRDQQRPAGSRDAAAAIWRAYRRWLATQSADHAVGDGWLASQEFLRHQRAPGTTCLSALHAGHPGTLSQAVNDSKGCGGVMRVAPAGLAGGDPFALGSRAAALTHGHSSGYLAAGALSLMVSELACGRDMREASAAVISRLEQADGGEEVVAALTAAVRAAERGPLSADAIGILGEGWTAEEALAIAVHCALAADGFRSGVLHAVNHGGDSDSTGAICGNLLGAALGAGAIDDDLLAGLEGRDVITQVADDLHDVFVLGQPSPAQRYPAEQEEDSGENSGGGLRGSAASGEQVYQGLRAQILTLDPAAAGLQPEPGHSVVWGVLMETAYPRGTATLVALADGTTSLYFSTGGGIIGGGFHQAVATATRSFLADLEDHLSMLRPDPDVTLPAAGQVIIRALTYTGRMSAEASEDDLGHGRHQLSPVFHAAHRVIAELRLVEEARSGHGSPPA
jgi:ADP-ribosylglycohydrolase